MRNWSIFMAIVLVFTICAVGASARKRAKKAKPPTVTRRCAGDDDCATTQIADGKCCPTLCQARAVSKRSAEALEKWSASCAPAGGCPALPCAPTGATAVACVDRRCVVRPVAGE